MTKQNYSIPDSDCNPSRREKLVSKHHGRNVKAENSSTEWETPGDFFDRLNREFNFGLDACANEENFQVSPYIHKDIDALCEPWSAHMFESRSPTVWMNPPYGREIYQWVEKAYHESRKGLTVVGLVPANTSPAWWHDYVMKASEIRFVRGRIHFLTNGVPKKDTNFDSAVVIWRPGSVSPVIGAMDARI